MYRCYRCSNGRSFIVSPFNPRMQEDELGYIIDDSEVKALFVGPQSLRLLSLSSFAFVK